MNDNLNYRTRYDEAVARLRSERRRQSVTQVQLAARLGKSQQYVSKFESGERRLDVIEFIDVADALGLDRTALIGHL